MHTDFQGSGRTSWKVAIGKLKSRWETGLVEVGYNDMNWLRMVTICRYLC